ncbi:hypothetical protein HMJ29_00865 [Hymenobacter taeanensis]|uniref:Uncharacterized protein n=1 Tax=Hymenobacter taeanensis TaxID=2735321 RepID=A0A6M6BBN9_9BACT|nr:MULTISPECIES: hypothetical protein [Hymenobacter]QJX45567.1 hypothetical protein HMJ29_00865 [Hymenobacter taeanensis]UOQ81186.1 hypothetical protein MUN83_20660 [Hymenobacter sp. 5414T-23]
MHDPASAKFSVLYHKRRARVERAKGLSHLVPAFVLIGGVLGVLVGEEPFTLLVGVELLVGVAYVGLLVREQVHLKRHPAHHERVAWLELAAAGILALEGYHIWHRHHEKALLTGRHQVHVLPWLYALLAVWYTAMAFGMARMYERRHLHLHAEGFSGRLHPFKRRFAFTWNEVVRVEPVGEADVCVHHADGRQQHLSFAALQDGPAHRNRLLEHAAQQGQGGHLGR